MKKLIESDYIKVATPLVVMIFCALISVLYAQQIKEIDKKAPLSMVKENCRKLEGKVDNETLLQMIKVIEVTNVYQDQRLSNLEKLSSEQLKISQKIQQELQKMSLGCDR